MRARDVGCSANRESLIPCGRKSMARILNCAEGEYSLLRGLARCAHWPVRDALNFLAVPTCGGNIIL
jgi:hypothetical protein